MDQDAPALHPELIDIADLTLDPENARLHDDRNVSTIGASLEAYKQRKAIVVNRRTMTVEAGNGTVRAALEAGHEQIVAVFVDDDDETAAAYAIADNRTADLATWDLDVLTTKVEAFPDVDWGALGFGADDLASLAGDGGSPGDGSGGSDPSTPPEEPPIPEPPSAPVTKLGDVIQLGPHVLHCADCMDVMAGLADNSVDFIGTDGPYGLSPDGKARTWDDLDELRRLRHKCQDRCPTHVVGLADIGDPDDSDPKAEQERITLRVRLSHRVVDEGGVEFDDGRQGWEVEVDSDRPVGHVEDLLVREWDLALREELAKGQLGLWVREGLAGCVGPCSCATECSHPFVGVLVGLRHDALAEAEGPAHVVTAPRTELRAVLRFHVGGRSADLFPARGASEVDAVLFLGRSEPVGASAAAGGLTTVFEAGGLGEVGSATSGALSFDLLAAGVLVDNSTHDPSVSKKGFMNKSWDGAVPGLKWARECLRILKPGGYLASFSSTRTYHRHACAIEDAGFDIIDQLSWLQWEGMPHGMNVSKAIDKAAGADREVIGLSPHSADRTADIGYGGGVTNEGERHITAPATDLAKAWDDYHTRLKPCFEPICLAQKPLEGTVVENIKKWGTGALNIGATRHPEGDPSWPGPNHAWGTRHNQAGSGVGSGSGSEVYGKMGAVDGAWDEAGRFPGNVFQYPKPSAREKTAGTDDTHERHTTVKPVAAMARLLRLGLPPGGGTAFEPFGGSGTTLVAASRFDCKVILSEREPGYMDIIRARGEWAIANAKAPA